MQIEQIRPELTWRLRQQILYPGRPLYEMEMEEDNDGLHFAAFKDNAIVSVISLFPRGDDFQFRKFAVDKTMRGMGIGMAMLEHITKFAAINGCRRLWCNARLPAIGFYLKAGFAQTGRLFSKNGLDYEVVEKLI